MGLSIDSQRQGKDDDALQASLEAYSLAPDGSFEKGRAARDSGAHYARLGEIKEAKAYAAEGFSLHDQLLLAMGEHPSRESYRERSASGMFLGAIGLREAIQVDKGGKRVTDTQFVDHLRESLLDIRAAKSQSAGINRIVDQYQINATRRVSVGESLYGSRKKGFALGIQAVALATMSESPKLDTTNPNLTTRDILGIKKKGLLGGVAALGVGILASPRQNKRRKLALSIAEKVL